jgi:hypothetical protein
MAPRARIFYSDLSIRVKFSTSLLPAFRRIGTEIVWRQYPYPMMSFTQITAQKKRVKIQR